jgi:hypothetical protein
MDYGFNSLNKNLNSRQSNNTNLFNNLENKDIIISVRIKSIVLNEAHPRFKELGEWNALGAVEYEIVNSPTSPGSFYPIAYPLNSNSKVFPLINEIVYVISLPSTDIGASNTKVKEYYLNTISLWNHPHHNGYPINSSKPPSEQRKDYAQTQAGSVRRVTDQSTEIFLGKTFKERSNIHPLLPFEGDVIQEGRWGNSIRFGSTVKDTPNNWSSTGDSGDPLIIIKNGQGVQTDQGWIPITENINNDNSSIYLTSTQKIPLEVISTSYVSYKDNVPTAPNEFAGKQIILNSGRLVFNSGEDHILLSSAKSINLNSQESVNIDTPTFIIQSNKMYLGSNKATEPLMLGNQTVDLLKNLINALDNFFTIMQTATTSPTVQGSPATLPTLNQSAVQVKGMLENIKTTLNKGNLTSNSNYTV